MKSILTALVLVCMAGIAGADYSYNYHSDKFGDITIPMTPVYVAGGLAAPAALQYGLGRVWKDPSLKARMGKVFIAHLGAAALMYYVPGRTRFIPRTLNSDPGDPAGTNFVMVTLSVSLPLQSLWVSWKHRRDKGS